MTEIRATIPEHTTVYIQQIQRFTELKHGPSDSLTVTAGGCGKSPYVLGRVCIIMKIISEHRATLISAITPNKH